MELERFRSSKVAKVIAALPYVAKCEDARQTAVNHLSLYVTAHKNPKFDALQSESIMTRLFDIGAFKSGDGRLIKKGMKILELLSLEDHYKDRELDVRLGKTNPISLGQVNYETEKLRLTNEINSIHSPQLDKIVLDDEKWPDIWF